MIISLKIELYGKAIGTRDMNSRASVKLVLKQCHGYNLLCMVYTCIHENGSERVYVETIPTCT